MQAALVAEAQRRDDEALATLIVQFRPGLVHLIAWAARNYRSGRWAEADDDVVATFGEVILHHRLDRRPRLIAANLLLDTRQKIWRAEGKESRSRQAVLTAAALAAPGPSAGLEAAGPSPEMQPDLVVEELTLIGQLANAIESLPGSPSSRRLTAEVAYRAWVLDEANSCIATEVGLAPDAVRARLSRLRSVVRDSVAMRSSAAQVGLPIDAVIP